MKKALAVLVLLLLAVGAYLVWDYLNREAQLRERIRVLQEVVSRLNAEYRVAQVLVRDQKLDESGQVVTTVEFRELDRDSRPLPPVTATLVGSESYFEALVIRFQNEYVEKGDALRGRSVILFRRMYGSATAPDQGVLIDPAASDGVPSVYRVSAKPGALEADLWGRFWFYASHPKEAAALGVSVMQVQAVGVRPVPNMIYELRVQNNGGMNILPLTAPLEK